MRETTENTQRTTGTHDRTVDTGGSESSTVCCVREQDWLAQGALCRNHKGREGKDLLITSNAHIKLVSVPQNLTV